MWSVFMSYMTLRVPHTLYGIGMRWFPPLPYTEQVSYGPPTSMYVPHMYLYDSYGPPYFM